jgi:hypothetical protein
MQPHSTQVMTISLAVEVASRPIPTGRAVAISMAS